MNVYFTASIVGKKEFLPLYEAIVAELKNRGFTVQADHILNMTESAINLETRENRLKFHQTLETWIQKADFILVESSFPSISVGYEISLALQYRKPILILYSVGDPPSLFAYHNDERIVCEKYTTTTLKGILDDFINYVHGSADTRFTFFITPQIAAYLEKITKKQKMPKSVWLRELIESHIKANPVK